MIKAGEISEIIKRQLAGYEPEVGLQEVGRVIEAGDGIARIYGLEKAMAGELLQFPGDVVGMVLNLEEDNVGAVLLGEDRAIKEGDTVKRTNRIAQVPGGEALVRRVVNALGQPVDGKGPIAAKEFRPIERYAPRVVDRRSVKEPRQTGLKALDAMLPLGRGRRRGGAARRAARHTRATSSTCTRGRSSGPRSSTTRSAAAPSRPCRSSRRSSATCRPTSRPTSSRSPTARSTWSPTCSTAASGPRSTSDPPAPAPAAPPRRRPCD